MDTAPKRYSAIGPLLPWRPPPLPDASVDQEDRQHVAMMYGGALAEGASDHVTVSGSIGFSLGGRRTTIRGE